jgi:hypothetical protein
MNSIPPPRSLYAIERGDNCIASISEMEVSKISGDRLRSAFLQSLVKIGKGGGWGILKQHMMRYMCHFRRKTA